MCVCFAGGDGSAEGAGCERGRAAAATTAAREGHAAAGQQDGGRPAPHAQQSAGETAETQGGKDEREGKTDEGEHDRTEARVGTQTEQ